jgi:hypothetical protein
MVGGGWTVAGGTTKSRRCDPLHTHDNPVHHTDAKRSGLTPETGDAFPFTHPRPPTTNPLTQ